MRRTYFVALSSLALAVAAGSAWGGDFWSRVHTDWHRNNMWPQPFIYADRAAACEPFAIQVNNGWRLQNTIGDAYFDSTSHELTLAGQAKVKSIVQQAPQSRRNIFVLMSDNEEATSGRVASVQQAAARYTLKGTPAEVQITDRDVFGGSGEYYDSVDRAMKSSVPPPRLPARSAGGGAGTGGGNSGAAGS